MKKKLIRTGIMAATLALASPVVPQAHAQQIDSIYITPKVLFSYQTGDLAPAKWRDQGDWTNSVLGGSEKDQNFGFGLAVGTDLGYSSELPVRLEGEYVYRSKGKFSKGPKTVSGRNFTGTAQQSFEVTAHSLMANAFYDINTDSAITPYFGLGLGLAYLNTDYSTSISNGDSASATSSTTNWNMAWNVGLGAAYHLNENMALDFGYRYVDLGTAESGNISMLNFNGSSEMDYKAHEFSVGLRVTGF